MSSKARCIWWDSPFNVQLAPSLLSSRVTCENMCGSTTRLLKNLWSSLPTREHRRNPVDFLVIQILSFSFSSVVDWWIGFVSKCSNRKSWLLFNIPGVLNHSVTFPLKVIAFILLECSHLLPISSSKLNSNISCFFYLSEKTWKWSWNELKSSLIELNT